MSMYVNDEYTYNIDELGSLEQVEKIRRLIIDCETPFVLGISGRWGSGKSSIMRYLMASLRGRVPEKWLPFQNEPLKDKTEEEELEKVREKYETKTDIEHIHSIWFNPWEHENHDEPVIELLKELRKHFSSVSKTMKEMKKLMDVGIRSGLNKLTSIIQKEGEKNEYENFEYSTRNQRFKLFFQNTIDDLLAITKVKPSGTVDVRTDPSAKLVIFIDDLDRCEETTITKLLKEIKQHLTTKRCVFVFGYDRHHVENALSKTIQLSDKETRSYLEKLFQSTIYIKQPSEEKFRGYVMDKLTGIDFIPEFSRRCLCELICKIIDRNPRRIKAYLTAFRFHAYSKVDTAKLKELSDDLQRWELLSDDLEQLALMTYIKVFHEPVYSVLESDNRLLKDLVKVFELNNRDAIANYNQYFFYLEMRSHLQDYDKTVISEKTIEREFLRNDYSTEKKFLSEIYEMQGRHKSYENFRNEFKNRFNYIIENNLYADIDKYI